MNKKTITAISAGTSYSMLKLNESSVDPYTRSAIGSILGFTLALSPNNNHRFPVPASVSLVVNVYKSSLFKSPTFSSKYGI
jgi:hypothetical protein